MEFPYVHSLVTYLHLHPHIGWLIVFVIAFSESLPILGAIIPGSVTMTAIGALIGSGAMPFTATLLWAILGAFCGDYFSYWLGAYYKDRIRTIWPFRKYPHWLNLGENFFQKHGGKSVIIGRFFGPVRSAVPLIAGLMDMSSLRFIIAALPSAILWSLVYIGPGILVGALALELPPATATKFILSILAIVAFGWIFVVILHFTFKKIALSIERFMVLTWHYFNKSPITRWFCYVLSYPNQINPHRQLMLLIAALIFVGLFIWIFASVLLQSGISHLNEPIFHLLSSIHTHIGTNLMIVATLLGDKYVLLPATVLIFIWLLWQRHFRAGIHWLAAVGLSATVAEGIKHFYYSPRPSGFLEADLTSSFPSGHVILSVAAYSFLAILVARSLAPSRRHLAYLCAAFLVFCVGISRLYLGAHWLTDVLGGIFLGLSCVLLVTLSYLARPSKPVPAKSLSLISLITIGTITLIYGLMNFRSMQDDYTPYWPKVNMTTQTWWKHQSHEIPLFIVSRLAKPNAVLNVQWLGSLAEIQQLLLQHDWKIHTPKGNLQGTLNRLKTANNNQHLPLFLPLYQNQTPVVLMTKMDPQQRQLNFVLWKSNVILQNSKQELWLGSLSYYIPHPHKEAIRVSPSQMHQLYEQAYRVFIEDLHGIVHQTIVVPTSQQPPIMQPLHWDGKLLMIKDS